MNVKMFEKDFPGGEAISKVGQPFFVTYYVHWWLPGSRAKLAFNKRVRVDSDGGYEEFDTVKDALQAVWSWQVENPQLVYAVVADLRCTVRVVRPRKRG